MTFAELLYKNVGPPRRPVLQVTLYYTILAVLGAGLDLLFFKQFGRHLFQQSGAGTFEVERSTLESFWVAGSDLGLVMSSLDLLMNLTMVVLLMLPVSWVYMATRARSGIDQAVVQTMILLPVAVTGVVVMVQHSVALAFSLAGIVAAVRFRNTLKKTSDALYIFTAIGVGLAAGTDNIGIAIVLTMFFNFTVLLLWRCDYGACPQGGPLPEYSSGKLLKAVGKHRKQKKLAKADQEVGLSEAAQEDES